MIGSVLRSFSHDGSFKCLHGIVLYRPRPLRMIQSDFLIIAR